MGTLTSNPARLSAFSNQVNPAGLDLHRTVAGPNDLGTWRAATAATFRAGQPVMLNADGEVVVSDGTDFLGVAKWSKMTLGRSVVTDEPVTFSADSQTKTLRHASLVDGAGAVSVNSATLRSGTAYQMNDNDADTPDAGEDVTINFANGTITHVAAEGITTPATVYVSYVWNLTAADYVFEGTNFWGSQDWVTIQDQRITVIQNPAIIFTTEFDPTVVYTTAGATSNIYINIVKTGLGAVFTSTATSNSPRVGHVIQIPTASDPFLGIQLDASMLHS